MCTLDGKELAVLLYEKNADLDQRTFPNERQAFPVQEYLSSRARGMCWESESPLYEIVPAEE